MTATLKAKTRTIAGHELTLAVGRRYLASRPMARRGMASFDVKIADITDGIAAATRSAVVAGLGYDDANDLLRAFNAGRTSFDGRVWR